MDKKLKHLEFIQGVINRLATNSFQMKGWTVVLVAAILVILARENRLAAAYIALAPILIFWALDGYFLWQERLYRTLYDRVRTLKESQIDFSMDVTCPKIRYTRSWWGAARSRTLLGFYVGLAALIVALAAVANWSNQEEPKWHGEFSSALSTNTTCLEQWSSAIAG